MHILQHRNSYPNKEQIKSLGGRAEYEGQKFVGWAMPSQEAYEQALALCEGGAGSKPTSTSQRTVFPMGAVKLDALPITISPPATTIWGGKLKALSREQVEALLPVFGYDLSRQWKEEMGEWIVRMAKENIQLGHPIAPPDWLEKTYPSAQALFEAFPDGTRSHLVILEAAAALVAGEAWLRGKDFRETIAMNARKLEVSAAELENKARAVIEAYREVNPNTIEGIKIEFLRYLCQVGCNEVKEQERAWRFVEECAKSESDEEILHSSLSCHFAPRHHNVVVDFIRRYEAVYLAQIEEMLKEEEATEEALYEQRYWEQARDDWEYDQLCPAAEIRIAKDRIEVEAFETGVGDILPKVKGRKYCGEMTWSFPLSAREKLEKLGFPVIFCPGVGEKTHEN